MKRILYLTLFVSAAGLMQGQAPAANQSPGHADTPTRQNPSEGGETDKSDEGSADAFNNRLPELEVKGESAWIEGNKFVFVPQKRVKRQAGSIANMVDLLDTGLLQVKDGAITTLAGQPVTVYINGLKADDLDQSNFWAMDVLKVEFLPVTDDPRFNGDLNVLNIVMKEYTVGGVTKFTTDDLLPGSEDLRVSSKVAYKKMSYTVMAKANHSYDHFTHSENIQKYEDVWYQDTHYDLIGKSAKSRSKDKNHGIYGGLNARFRNEQWTAAHHVDLKWNQDPGSSTYGSLTFSPDIISGNRAWAHSSSRSLAPHAMGEYTFNPTGPWSFTGIWNFYYGHNRYVAENREGDAETIYNLSKENILEGWVFLNAGRRFGQKHSLRIALQGISNSSHVDYSGNAESRQKISNNYGILMLGWYFTPSANFYISLSSTGILERRKVNGDYSTTQFLPSGRLFCGYTINSRHALFLQSDINNTFAGSSTVNDLTLRQTELTWIEGNPRIKSSLKGSVGLNYHAQPLDWLGSDLYCGWNVSGKNPVLQYRSGGREHDGVIARYGNAHTLTHLSAYWALPVRLFDGNLRLCPDVRYENYRVRNVNSVHDMAYSMSVRYMFGDFNASVDIESPRKKLTNGGSETIREPLASSISLSYGNGNLHASLNLDSPLKKYAKTTSTFTSGPYTNHTVTWKRAMQLNVFLSYTFGYGKKIDPDIDIQETPESTSAVLGH